MQRFRKIGFTLIELLVVIAIIAVLAGLLFPVFIQAKNAAKLDTCMSNIKEVGQATALYAADHDDWFPQTKRSSSNPAFEDAAGALDEPDYASYFGLLEPYAGQHVGLGTVFSCPIDPDPRGNRCLAINPDIPDLTSYLVNGYLTFGLSGTAIRQPSDFVLYAERRSEVRDGVSPYCDYTYRPWFNRMNPLAREDDMDPVVGAVATKRHQDRSLFAFADGSVRLRAWSQTFDPAAGKDLHTP
jgi:prepilin-type N-terminal cleavage/methylation domain-containing protein/prepilin-type processing-associated H-X9-DG protein